MPGLIKLAMLLLVTLHPAILSAGTIAPGEDPLLLQLVAAAPKGWTATCTATELRFARREHVWVLSENRMNALVAHENAAARQQRFQKNGTTCEMVLTCRLIPRWDAIDKAAADALSADIGARLASLAVELGVKDLLQQSRKGQPIPRSDDEAKRLATYEERCAEIERLRPRFPDLQTARSSLFFESKQDYDDAFHETWPDEAVAELGKLRAKLVAIAPPSRQSEPASGSRSNDITGLAVNTKSGAAMQVGHEMVYIAERDAWPEILLNKALRINGRRRVVSDLPVFIPKPGEPQRSGMPVPEGTDLEEAARRTVIDVEFCEEGK